VYTDEKEKEILGNQERNGSKVIYDKIFAHSSYIRKLFLIYDFATAPI
jgi:hypothetical protein